MPTIITGVASDETVSVKWVPTIADVNAPKLATEINAAPSVTLECLLTETFSPDASAEVGEVRRMCSKQVQQRGGTVTLTIEDLIYAYDPQGLAAAPINKAYAALVQGAKGYLVVRWGKHVDTAWAVGDKVDIWPVEISYGPVKLRSEANSELKAKSGVLVTGTVATDKALVA